MRRPAPPRGWRAARGPAADYPVSVRSLEAEGARSGRGDLPMALLGGAGRAGCSGGAERGAGRGGGGWQGGAGAGWLSRGSSSRGAGTVRLRLWCLAESGAARRAVLAAWGGGGGASEGVLLK